MGADADRGDRRDGVDGSATGPVPLGPDSLTWKYFGDWRGLLISLGGSMQNMHPGLGAGVEQHSLFFAERWQRLFRSLYPIGGVVYDGPRAHRTALQVRGYHETIKGVDAQGRRYHALDPDTYYWAHATFFVSTLRIAESFMVLEDNKATRDVLDIGELAKPNSLPWLPHAVWRLVRRPVARGFVWLTVGMYDQPVRDLLGYRWSARDRWLHGLVGTAVNLAFRLVPHDRRYHPRARAGWRRVAGKAPADTPPVETPARNLPPLNRRDSPTHYSPQV